MVIFLKYDHSRTLFCAYLLQKLLASPCMNSTNILRYRLQEKEQLVVLKKDNYS